MRWINAQYAIIKVSYLSPKTINKFGLFNFSKLENLLIILEDFFKIEVESDLFSLSLIF